MAAASWNIGIVGLAWVLSVGLVAAEEADCSDEESCRNKSVALRLKIAAIASILVASTIGVTLPIVGRSISALKPDRDVFFVIKAFAAGVILATGFIHVLPDAFEALTNPCLNDNPWGKFPFSGFIAMMAALMTLMADSLATGYYERYNLKKQKKSIVNGASEEQGQNVELQHGNFVQGHSHGAHGHALDHESGASLIRHRVISQVLELGIVAHSVIIGISLGASQSPCTIRPLVAALTFHQFFEGMGLGGCIVQASLKNSSTAIMAFFFAVTTPFGIAVGIAISSVYNENSPTALIVEGVFDSASAGILIYMSLVDLLAADFMSARMQNSARLQVWSYSALLLGAGAMSLIAKWA